MRSCIIQICITCIFFSFFLSDDFTHNPEKGRCQCLTPFLRAPLGFYPGLSQPTSQFCLIGPNPFSLTLLITIFLNCDRFD